MESLNTELKVPQALDRNSRLTRPSEAVKGEDYFCPGCGSALIFKKGSEKVAHFAHESSVICSQETIVHKTAKLAIQAIIRARNFDKFPLIVRQCETCHLLGEQYIPAGIDEALLEYPLTSGHIADVALLSDGSVRAAVEIRVTHAVGEDKAEALAAIQMPFIELDGYEIIETPQLWKPIKCSFKPRCFACPACQDALRHFQNAAKAISAKTEIPLPDAYYRYGISNCYRCKQPLLVFTWPGHLPGSRETPRFMPRPRTLQYRFTAGFGHKYWVNTCPACGATQGDTFLYLQGALKYCDYLLEQTPELFRSDQIYIARYWVEHGIGGN